MSLVHSQNNVVTYDLNTLSFRGCHGPIFAGRFPNARNPILRWVLAVVFLCLGLALLGFIVGMAEWPRFQIETMAIAFGTAGAILPLLTLSRLQRAASRLRREGQCTTELSREGILRRTLTRECKYRWMPGQRFLLRGDEVLIFIASDEILWLPRRAFASAQMVESFLQYGTPLSRRCSEPSMSAIALRVVSGCNQQSRGLCHDSWLEAIQCPFQECSPRSGRARYCVPKAGRRHANSVTYKNRGMSRNTSRITWAGRVDRAESRGDCWLRVRTGCRAGRPGSRLLSGCPGGAG